MRKTDAFAQTKATTPRRRLSLPFCCSCALLLFPLSSCSSEPPTQRPAASAKGSFFLRNDSRSTLTVQPFEAGAPGETRAPVGEAFTIPPGRTDSRIVGVPGRFVVLTIRASDQNFKYQSGEWVVREPVEGFNIYAFTDDSGTVRLSWNSRDGEEILMH
ncbi:MAG: hypothetical protein J0L78_03760 [Planctomycetes bacterium]|nr:hypothetical protein [Planctomycetota bacterium]